MSLDVADKEQRPILCFLSSFFGLRNVVNVNWVRNEVVFLVALAPEVHGSLFLLRSMEKITAQQRDT